MSVTIERIQEPADDAAERALAVAHARYERSVTDVPLDWGHRISRLIASGRLDLFVARAENESVGYATLTQGVDTWSAEPYGFLDCLFVAEEHRSAGLGAQLIDAVVAHARSLGLAELQWQTPAWNEGAIRFYNRLGAEQRSKEVFMLALE